jgi:hypothetical protein
MTTNVGKTTAFDERLETGTLLGFKGSDPIIAVIE